MIAFLADVRAVFSLFPDVREARRAGAAAIRLAPVFQLHAVDTGAGFLDTVEGCLLENYPAPVKQPVKAFFHALPRETRQRLAFSPKHGEYLARAQFWCYSLLDVLPPAEYHKAIGAIVRWYRVCRYNEIAKTPQEKIAYRERLTGRNLSERERELYSC